MPRRDNWGKRKNDKMNVVDAKFEAQKLAFSPIYFQTAVALIELGILDYIYKNRRGVKIADIAKATDISEYGIKVLLEAAQNIDLVEYLAPDTVKLSKLGFFVLHDEMTKVNINFVNDVCYSGAKSLVESIKNGKPEGLKVFGDWMTVYEGLSQLPEKVKKSWFEFDHYYSDVAFPFALEIVWEEKPKYIFDIGGNTGKWAMACCNYDAAVKVKILDLPGQLNVARKNVVENKLDDRIDFHKINLLDASQEIPKGADAIWMSQFLDCFSEEEIVIILKNVCQASDENTCIYIMETFIDNQDFPAAQHCLTGTSLYFTTIANGNSKMYSTSAMYKLVKASGLEVVKEFPLIGDNFHTILKCKRNS